MKHIFNPYLPSFEYVPDGEPHAFNGRIYLYGSHDRFHGAFFCMNDYICYSAPQEDLTDWRYEGVIFRKDQDPRNQEYDPNRPEYAMKNNLEPVYPEDLNPPHIHCMWAPDVVQGPDGRYYLYYCLDCLPEIAVAVCDTPAGSYEFYGYVHDQEGNILGLREGDRIQFDPGIFVDEDGEIYLYSGNAPREKNVFTPLRGSQVMKLQPDMLTLKEEPRLLIPDINQAVGTAYENHEFFEASSIRKINGLYYFVYSSLRSHELCYAISDRPDGEYCYGGTLVDIGDVFLDGRTNEEAINPLGNTHGGIECADGKWYVFYHRQTNRTNFSRQACAEKIGFDENGRIAQAEVTSCGLNNGPLPFPIELPARVCCHLTGPKGAIHSNPTLSGPEYPYLTQDEKDFEPTPERIQRDQEIPYQYIANLQDGSVVGYKYFAGIGKFNLSAEIRGDFEGEIQVFTEKMPPHRYCYEESLEPLCKISVNSRGLEGAESSLGNSSTSEATQSNEESVSSPEADKSLLRDPDKKRAPWHWTGNTSLLQEKKEEFPLYLVFKGNGHCDLRRISVKETV